MRKLLLATAALAALGLAGAASAQSVNVNGYIHNASGSPQVSNLTLSGLSVGSTLDGSGLSVGNVLNVNSVDNITAGSSRLSMLNTSNQTSTVNASASNIAGEADFGSLAGGNSASFIADDALSLQVVVQANPNDQTSNLNLQGGLNVGGNVAASSTAFGNSIYGQSEFSTINVSARAERQSNVGDQRANLIVSGSNRFGIDAALSAVAVGNVMEFDAEGTGTYTINQANGRDADFVGLVGYAGSSQTATLTVNPGSTFVGAADLSAAAVGNIATLTGGADINAVLDIQSHNSTQLSNLTISGSSFGALTGAAQSIGNSVNITTRP